jgi:DNA polymerase-3 subunit epsilon
MAKKWEMAGMSSFLAIDFETANDSRTSACAVGLVLAEGQRIAARRAFLIRPPQRYFAFTHIHGLTWSQVCEAPTFADLWPIIAEYIRKADFLVAHNAAFDEGVLRACCEHYSVRVLA